MTDTPRHVLALWALGLVVVVVLGVRYLGRGGDPPSGSGAAPAIQVGEANGGPSRVTVPSVAANAPARAPAPIVSTAIVSDAPGVSLARNVSQ